MILGAVGASILAGILPVFMGMFGGTEGHWVRLGLRVTAGALALSAAFMSGNQIIGLLKR